MEGRLRDTVPWDQIPTGYKYLRAIWDTGLRREERSQDSIPLVGHLSGIDFFTLGHGIFINIIIPSLTKCVTL